MEGNGNFGFEEFFLLLRGYTSSLLNQNSMSVLSSATLILRLVLILSARLLYWGNGESRGCVSKRGPFEITLPLKRGGAGNLVIKSGPRKSARGH
jgi:hypothetical protein